MKNVRLRVCVTPTWALKTCERRRHADSCVTLTTNTQTGKRGWIACLCYSTTAPVVLINYTSTGKAALAGTFCAFVWNCGKKKTLNIFNHRTFVKLLMRRIVLEMQRPRLQSTCRNHTRDSLTVTCEHVITCCLNHEVLANWRSLLQLNPLSFSWSEVLCALMQSGSRRPQSWFNSPDLCRINNNSF